jgi:hypothetical protein
MKLARDIPIFFALVLGLLLLWCLAVRGWFLASPTGWLLLLAGVALESCILRDMYKNKSQKADHSN